MTSDAHRQRLEWALGELTGAAVPPDLAARTAARFAAGDGRRLPPPSAIADAIRPPRRWLVAAALVFGTAVVGALVCWRGDLAPAPAQDAKPEPAPVQVASRQEIEALPADTRAVVGQGLDDAAVTALLRLRELRSLELVYREAMALGLELKMAPPVAPPCITGRSFGTLAQLGKLRVLRLRGAHAITESFPLGGSAEDAAAITATTLGELARLPLLEELALSHFDVPSYALATLPRLQSLRRLDLTANYGVDATAVAALSRCTGLEVLTLRACMTLPAAAIGQLSALPRLRELDVGDIDGMAWRSSPGEFFGPATAAWLADARTRANAGVCGVTDAALRSLAAAPALRCLRMTQPRCTLAGFDALRDFPVLERLELFGFGGEPMQVDALAELLPPLRELVACGAFGDAFCRELRRRQPRLERLELPACYAITDAGLAELLRIDTLRELDVRQSRGLTAGAMTALCAARQLEVLDLRHVDWVTAEHVQTLRAALPRLRTLRTNVGDDGDPQRAR